MKYTFEVKRIRHSVTQGSAAVLLNGEEVLVFGDKIELVDGEWKSTIPDEQFIIGLLFHKHDDIYHYSDKVKEILNRGAAQ